MNRKVTTQAEFDAAVKAGETPEISTNVALVISAATVVIVSGSSQPRVVCSDSSQPRVECYGSSQPRVVCSGSSQPRVVCYGSSQPRVVCYDSSQPRVECYGSSQPRVVCYGSSQPRVVCYGSSQPRVVCYDSSQPRVECSGSSQPRVVCYGSSQPRVVCYDSSQPRVECYGSSQPRVVCSGSSQPRVVCYGSSQPRVVCYDSSQPRVECYDSSQPRVECSGVAQLSITGAGVVTASAKNSIVTDGKAKIEGGIVIQPDPITSALEWCEVFGVPVVDDVAILFKAVGSDFMSPKGADYSPGLIPVAADWDGGRRECGGGLHFSPRPAAALAFNMGADKFVACPVALSDIRVPKPTDDYPSKVKARGCCKPVWECDIDGTAIAKAAPAAEAGGAA